MKKKLNLGAAVCAALASCLMAASCTNGADGDRNVVYASKFSDLANSRNYADVKGYASSNLRQSKTTPVSVGNLTDGSTSVLSYVIANTAGADANPWFAVDLGSVKRFNKIRIVPGAGQDAEEKYPDAYPVKYRIQFSRRTQPASSPEDIVSFEWKTAATVTDGTLSAKSVSFEEQTARWIRILVDEYNGEHCALMELSVFAPDRTRTYESLGKEVNVLFIGNSLTYYNNMWSVFEGIALKKEKNVKSTAVTFGGKNLIYHSNARNTETAIKAGNFDYVVLQDICGSFTDEKLAEGSDSIIPKIMEANPNAKIVYYSTWPKHSVREERTAEFTACYLKAAQKHKALLAPVGEVLYDLSKTNGRNYYDSGDDTHPKPIASFLAACSIYHTIFQEGEAGPFTDSDCNDISDLINSYVSDSSSGKEAAYDVSLINQINSLSFQYARAVQDAAADSSGKTKYTSVAGDYEHASVE